MGAQSCISVALHRCVIMYHAHYLHRALEIFMITTWTNLTKKGLMTDSE